MPRHLSTLVGVLLLTLTACGGGDDTATTGDLPADDGGPGVVEVVGVDYGYEGVPASVPAGTSLRFRNASTAEAHEVVLMRIPDGEDRSVADLMQLPPDELFGLVMPNLVGVSVAPPEADGMVVEGNLDDLGAGRYALFCVIPTGADPDEYMTAAAESDGPPQVDGGPPHIVNGMFAELTVTG
jgi:hypothetical protein